MDTNALRFDSSIPRVPADRSDPVSLANSQNPPDVDGGSSVDNPVQDSEASLSAVGGDQSSPIVSIDQADPDVHGISQGIIDAVANTFSRLDLSNNTEPPPEASRNASLDTDSSGVALRAVDGDRSAPMDTEEDDFDLEGFDEETIEQEDAYDEYFGLGGSGGMISDSRLPDDTTCPIILDLIRDRQLYHRCDHCSACISKEGMIGWIRKSRNCPACGHEWTNWHTYVNQSDLAETPEESTEESTEETGEDSPEGTVETLPIRSEGFGATAVREGSRFILIPNELPDQW